jgi:dipeptidyl-peptidase-4
MKECIFVSQKITKPMKKISFLLIAIMTTFMMFAQTLTLQDIVEGKYRPKGVQSVVSSADGEYYFQANTQKSKIIKYAYKTGLAVDTIFDSEKARDCNFASFQGFLISPDENRLLLYNNSEQIYRRSFKADYYYFDIRRNLVRKLTENKEKQMAPVFSRDGRMLAYVCNNNIWLSKFDYGTESQVTKDGAFGKIINGATDWAYEEEFGVTVLMDFSPDNKLLSFVKFDESNVPEFSFQVYQKQLYPSLMSFKYPKAGESNSKVTCNVFDIESKTIRQVNFLSTDIEYIPRIEFVPNGQLAVMTLNRNQNDFNLYFSDPRTTISKLVLREQNERYVDYDFFNSIHFIGDQFTYISEKDGYSHIYLYSMAGVLQKQLTSGSYDVTQILACDPVSKTIYYEAAEDSPMQRSVYKVDLNKSVKTKLSTKAGYNSADFSSNGMYYINNWSDATSPNLITLHNSSGKELRVLEDNKDLKAKLASMNLPKKEFIKVKGADGSDLNAWILKPANFDSNRKYPLLMVQYSGPNSQQVLDRFGLDWVDYLVTQGFIVASVDGRGTGARGEEFRKCTYMNLGIKESDDQIAAARYFSAFPYIDSKNMSIWGWSYGGYNVLMSLSRSNGVFKSGIAIAPVTDWRFYDSVYTERYMRTPQQNATGYNSGSPVELAQNLNGRLLLIHGSADDNVHFQNTMAYTSALIRSGKQFDLFVFPDMNHSIPGAINRSYLYEKIINFLKIE